MMFLCCFFSLSLFFGGAGSKRLGLLGRTFRLFLFFVNLPVVWQTNCFFYFGSNLLFAIARQLRSQDVGAPQVDDDHPVESQDLFQLLVCDGNNLSLCCEYD